VREAQCPSDHRQQIIECAIRGDATLSRLTETGYAAAMQLGVSAQSVRKKEAAN